MLGIEFCVPVFFCRRFVRTSSVSRPMASEEKWSFLRLFPIMPCARQCVIGWRPMGASLQRSWCDRHGRLRCLVLVWKRGWHRKGGFGDPRETAGWGALGCGEVRACRSLAHAQDEGCRAAWTSPVPSAWGRCRTDLFQLVTHTFSSGCKPTAVAAQVTSLSGKVSEV